MKKEPDDPVAREGDVTRRAFLEGAGVAIVATATLPVMTGTDAAAQSAPVASPGAATTRIVVTVNGAEHRLEVGDHWTLAELLRDHLTLTGTKLGCERGECGACTVLLDGAPVYACSYLAVWSDGKKVETVEGLMRNGQLSPLQQAFVEHDAPQCGYCTSGQLMSAAALLRRNPRPTSADARNALAGNICRCSNYNRIVEAVVAAGQRGASARSGGA
jgi:xanthine dehydrogenase YagT iron-sulfur-binding subunit